MGKRPYHDPETLRRLYHDEGMTQGEIADRFGVKSNTISEWMSRHGITTRPHQDAPHKDAAVLRFLHHDQGLTLKQMGEQLGRHSETVRNWMEKHDIQRQSANREQYDIPETELRRMYEDEKMSAKECASEFGCSMGTVLRRLREYEIPIRDNSGAQRAKYGERVCFTDAGNGYNKWVDEISGGEIFVHQLLAIATGADPAKVFSGGRYCVHHKNTIPFDNRPGNVELLNESDHAATHRADEWRSDKGFPELKTTEA